MTELALRFAAYAPGVSTITLGTSTAAMVRSALDMLGKGPLPQDVMTQIRREHVWTKNFYEALL
jgi:aryl-alcohol dehydrogenase-like predicted oxidoreductase